MALDVLITTNRITADPNSRELIDHLRHTTAKLRLDDAALYYDFPIFSDYETVTHKPDALLVSPRYGVIAIRFFGLLVDRPASLEAVAESLTQFCSILIGRLLKSQILRKTLSTLKFDVTPVIFATASTAGQNTDLPGCVVIHSLAGFDSFLLGSGNANLDADGTSELRSVIEGAKALTRPKKRNIDEPKRQPLAVALAKLEAEIANFDQRQRRAALVTVPGAQRIRGLAGSGKTVILAMKAAYLHLTQPKDRILVCFFTRSLRATLKNLVTRFYRHYRDEDPDWNQIHIRHGWGGGTTPGVYADACRRTGLMPLIFSVAKQMAGGKLEPFDFACRALLDKAVVKPHYDHVLIDEGQDFPGSFYELCYFLANGQRDSKNIVWAYDELQNILDVKIRSPEQLFGTDKDGQPRVSLDRTRASLPPGAENDAVLAKCYRNQREVLVTAHALGFGIYRDIVQLLESREHWQDVGYEVVSEGEFAVGRPVRILRPEENSPINLQAQPQKPLIAHYEANSLQSEIEWIAEEISEFIGGGLQPEDLLVVALDDRNARTYLRGIASALAEKEIATNNITADPYTEPPFVIAGKVTLSTVYRAKGNEASVVFATGVDAIPFKTRIGRNKLFTAFTRSKAWLRVSGIGEPARKFGTEIDAAKDHFPYLEFTMPDLEKIELIQRDLGKKAVRARKLKAEVLKKLKNEGLSDEEIADLFSQGDKDAKA